MFNLDSLPDLVQPPQAPKSSLFAIIAGIFVFLRNPKKRFNTNRFWSELFFQNILNILLKMVASHQMIVLYSRCNHVASIESPRPRLLVLVGVFFCAMYLAGGLMLPWLNFTSGVGYSANN
ncbi:hypothetical protein BIY40_07575 [Pediococcus acidilactici]|nr:hypothetical protein BIY40_07575 [Pediococcus acidilactici]